MRIRGGRVRRGRIGIRSRRRVRLMTYPASPAQLRRCDRERGAVPSGDGSDLGVDALPHQPKQIADDHIGEPQEFVEWPDRHVLNVTDDLEETLDLRGGAQGDPQVPPEL